MSKGITVKAIVTITNQTISKGEVAEETPMKKEKLRPQLRQTEKTNLLASSARVMAAGNSSASLLRQSGSTILYMFS